MIDILIFFFSALFVFSVLGLIGAGLAWVARKVGIRIND